MELARAQKVANEVEARRIKQREYTRRHRLANRDKINARRRELRHNNRDRENTSRREWRKRHPDSYRRTEITFWAKVKSIWGPSSSLPPREVYQKIELYALTNVLPSLGFTNITYLKNDPGFTFDFAATLNGRSILIDVTCAARRCTGKKLKLARALGLPFFVLFISPNLKFHYLQDMTTSRNGWAHVPWAVLKTFIAAEETDEIS